MSSIPQITIISLVHAGLHWLQYISETSPDGYCPGWSVFAMEMLIHPVIHWMIWLMCWPQVKVKHNLHQSLHRLLLLIYLYHVYLGIDLRSPEDPLGSTCGPDNGFYLLSYIITTALQTYTLYLVSTSIAISSIYLCTAYAYRQLWLSYQPSHTQFIDWNHPLEWMMTTGLTLFAWYSHE